MRLAFKRTMYLLAGAVVVIAITVGARILVENRMEAEERMLLKLQFVAPFEIKQASFEEALQ